MKRIKLKKTDDCILAIDSGTQSIRTALIDPSGNICDIEKTPIEPYFSNEPGWAEQDPEYYWKVLCTTSKKFFKKDPLYKKVIRGVTVTTQRSTVINLDRNGRPLRPAIVWLDRRKAGSGHWPSALSRFALRALNLLESLDYAVSECEANWIMQNQPGIWEKTWKYLFLSGFLTYRLTGDFFDSTGSQVGYVPFDYRNHEWLKKSSFVWKLFPIDRGMLPELVKPSETLGQISRKASNETGIPAGLPLIASAADKACEVLGSGCLNRDIACLSYGTTATVETTNDKYFEVIPFAPSYPSAVPGKYNTEVIIYRGYWMVSWFKKQFGFREEQLAAKKKIPPERLFDEMIKDIPPGSMGLTLQPYWSPGIKTPGIEAKGAIVGFGDIHTKSHIYRAILEGIAYALKEGAIRTERKTGNKISALRVSGGGSQSNSAMQITADIFGLPAERPHTYETSALGAAIDASVGLNFYPDFNSAVKGMTRVGRVFEPIPENRRIYEELYKKVYLRMYKRLKPLYDNIRSITGYPGF